MRRRRFIDRKEVEIRVRRARGREHRATPWWKLAGERVGRVQRASTRRGSAGIGSRSKLHTRRSVVKASYSRNDRSGRWTAHARYLTREGAQRQQAHGIGFDSAADGLDVVTTVRGWQKSGDELMWRLIVSPEDAPRLDLETHARDLVASMERDLETRLEWIGIDHNNTDNPHVHILIRGRDEHGQKLEIATEYVKSGIRARSQEIVQRELGLRPERELVAAREKVIDQRRWTDLDWSIKQRSGGDSRVSYHGDWNALSERQRERYSQEVRRLRSLERLGLASERGEMTWELKQDWERELRRMQRDNDTHSFDLASFCADSRSQGRKLGAHRWLA
jgi:type IV secretory pathway VirD2 relaxase